MDDALRHLRAGGLFFVLLALAWFVRYPDIVEAPVVLITANPPIRVIAKSGGRVDDRRVLERVFGALRDLLYSK